MEEVTCVTAEYEHLISYLMEGVPCGQGEPAPKFVP